MHNFVEHFNEKNEIRKFGTSCYKQCKKINAFRKMKMIRILDIVNIKCYENEF